jgi:hypothetical protein
LLKLGDSSPMMFTQHINILWVIQLSLNMLMNHLV